MIKLLLATAFIGHIICFGCDLLLTYSPSGKFNFKVLNDNEKMSVIFEKMPPKNPVISMLLGVLALAMCFCGYLGLGVWIGQFSGVYRTIIFVSSIIYFIPVTAHHVFCGVVEWFYIKLGRTEDARQLVVEFLKKTSATMYAAYLGLAVFAVTFFIAVVSGGTALPRWSCIFNTIPMFAVMSLLKAPGSGNLAGAAMFLGLLFLL